MWWVLLRFPISPKQSENSDENELSFDSTLQIHLISFRFLHNSNPRMSTDFVSTTRNTCSIVRIYVLEEASIYQSRDNIPTTFHLPESIAPQQTTNSSKPLTSSTTVNPSKPIASSRTYNKSLRTMFEKRKHLHWLILEYVKCFICVRKGRLTQPCMNIIKWKTKFFFFIFVSDANWEREMFCYWFTSDHEIITRPRLLSFHNIKFIDHISF